MKDSSRADAEFIDTACHDPEFISAPSLPRPRGICHRVKLPRPENHRRSFPTDIHHRSPPFPQMVITGVPPRDPRFIRRRSGYHDPECERGEVVLYPVPSHQQAGGGNLSASIFTTRNLSMPISTTRNLLVLIFSRGNLSEPVRKFNRYVYRYPGAEEFLGRENLITRNLSIKGGSFDVDTRFHIDFYRGAFITSPFSVSRPEIHH